MHKLHALVVLVVLSVLYAVVSDVIAAEDPSQVAQENPFAGKIVRVHVGDSFVLVESPRLTAIHGRMTLHGRELDVKSKHLFDEDVSEPWVYRRSNGDVYIAWQDATVCKAFDPGVFQLADDE